MWPDMRNPEICWWSLMEAHRSNTTYHITTTAKPIRPKLSSRELTGNWHPVKELNALFGTGDATPRHRVWLTFATWEGLEDTFVPLVLRHAQVVQELNFSGVKLLLLEKKS